MLRPFNILLLGWFVVDAGTFIIAPVIGPVVREMGVGEFQASLIVSAGSFVVAMTSPFWGRRTDTWGRRIVFIAGLLGVAAGSALFGFTAHLGLAGYFSLPLLLVLLIGTRLLGAFTMPGVWPPAMAYVADTYTGAERTARMGIINAATGLGMVLGPALIVVTAGIGLVAPFYLAALIPMVPAVLAWRWLPESKGSSDRQAASRLSPFDGRLWPYLAVGFTVALAWALITMNAGFYFQDRLGLSTQATAQLTGAAFVAFGFAMLVAQLGLVRWLNWSPVRLLNTALVLLLIGFLLWYLVHGPVTMTLALIVMGCGVGLGLTGFFAAPTEVVGRGEQGAVAGLINGAYALAFALGPLVGAALYEAGVDYPISVCLALLGAGLLLSLLHPRMRATV